MALDKNPIATKAVTSAVLTLAGDLICQVPHLFFHLKLYSEFVAHGIDIYYSMRDGIHNVY